jgi:hypothetical protein
MVTRTLIAAVSNVIIHSQVADIDRLLDVMLQAKE